MQEMSLQPFVSGLKFGECPRWHAGKLWYSDMAAHRVCAVDLDGSSETIVELEHPAGLGWLPDGRMLVAQMRKRRISVYAGGSIAPWADLSDVSLGCPNDMVVDKLGRVYVGSTGADMYAGEAPGHAGLVLVQDGRPRVVVPAPTLMFPNGCVITPDGETLIIAETLGCRITAFDIDTTSGSLSNRRSFASTEHWMPDGICLDAEGAVWFAAFNTGDFIRIKEGGEITHIVRTGDRRAAACMTGGRNNELLFVLSADTSHERLMKNESEGRIDIVELSVPGVCM